MAGPLAVLTSYSTIYEYSSACLFQANLPKMTPCTKHIDVAYHQLCEYVLPGMLHSILKIDTAVNPANIFTKDLVAEKFTAICKLVCSCDISLPFSAERGSRIPAYISPEIWFSHDLFSHWSTGPSWLLHYY